MRILKGKKTYLAAGASLLYAAAGLYTQALSVPEALQVAQVAVMGAFVRNAIGKPA